MVINLCLPQFKPRIHCNKVFPAPQQPALLQVKKAEGADLAQHLRVKGVNILEIKECFDSAAGCGTKLTLLMHGGFLLVPLLLTHILSEKM